MVAVVLPADQTVREEGNTVGGLEEGVILMTHCQASLPGVITTQRMAFCGAVQTDN